MDIKNVETRMAALDTRNRRLLANALSALLTRYVKLVECGDCGNWDPETEDEVKLAREVLALNTEFEELIDQVKAKKESLR